MIEIEKIPENQIKGMAEFLNNKIIEFFQDPVNQKEFEEWHMKTYGVLPTNASYMQKDVV